jgi:ElaB/YqjD/DUF883 family membrane-anchored ribosome-binding protein
MNIPNRRIEMTINPNNMGAVEQDVALRNQRNTSTGPEVADVKAAAQQLADDAREKAGELGEKASDGINSAMNTAGQQLQDLAHTVRERAPGEKIGELADNTAKTLERGANYLQDKDVTAVREDLEAFIRQHPMEAVLVGLGIGFLAARSMRR